MRLGLLLLAALVLGLLPAIAGEHHAPAAYGGQAGVEHIHPTAPEPCTQDHAADGECAALSSCPVGALRDCTNATAHLPELPALSFPASSALLGRSILPETQPPRRTVFI